MKYLILNLFFIVSVYANPLQQMNRRLDVYSESIPQCPPGQERAIDDGLFIDVSCEFSCVGAKARKEYLRGAFIPVEQGLYPGNGSNNENTLWSAVGVAMKSWSERLCLEKASEGCKGLQQVSSAHVKGINSGEWSISSFPSCSEKSLTLSPFNNAILSNRIFNPKLVSIDTKKKMTDFSLMTPFDELNVPLTEVPLKDSQKCKKLIKASLCFGDCVDLSSKGNDFIETLGTPEPLGREGVSVCGDALAQTLKLKKTSAQVKQSICESYFWTSLIRTEGNMFKSCAAVRGSVDCKAVIE